MAKEKIRFEAAFQRLEELVAELEKGHLETKEASLQAEEGKEP